MSNGPVAANRPAIIERSLMLMEREEARAVRRVAAAYRQARLEIVDYLLTHIPNGIERLTNGQRVEVARRIGLLRAIDERLIELERELGIVLRDVVSSSTEMAIDQIQREINLLPASMRPTVDIFTMIDSRMIEQFIPIGMADIQLGTRAISLQLQREIQNGLIQGESFPVLIRRLMAATSDPELGTSVWRRGQLSIELMIRRLVITTANAAKNDVLRQMNAEGGTQVQRQAIAVMSPETTDCCVRVHGQIVDVDEPFTLTGTPRFSDQMMHPSFHWNCRTSIAMYHPLFEQGGLTTENMRASAAAELRRRQ